MQMRKKEGSTNDKAKETTFFFPFFLMKGTYLILLEKKIWGYF